MCINIYTSCLAPLTDSHGTSCWRLGTNHLWESQCGFLDPPSCPWFEDPSEEAAGHPGPWWVFWHCFEKLCYLDLVVPCYPWNPLVIHVDIFSMVPMGHVPRTSTEKVWKCCSKNCIHNFRASTQRVKSIEEWFWNTWFLIMFDPLLVWSSLIGSLFSNVPLIC